MATHERSTLVQALAAFAGAVTTDFPAPLHPPANDGTHAISEDVPVQSSAKDVKAIAI
jgi:hypothetical protein